MRHQQLSRQAVEFRRLLIDLLWDEARFGYIDPDRFIGSCPICAAAVGVRFHGFAARADVRCYGGCAEKEITAALRRQMTEAAR